MLSLPPFGSAQAEDINVPPDLNDRAVIAILSGHKLIEEKFKSMREQNANIGFNCSQSSLTGRCPPAWLMKKSGLKTEAKLSTEGK